MRSLISTDEFRETMRSGQAAPDATICRFSTSEPVSVAGSKRTKRFTFSDATVDHAGDSIDPKGWDLSIFLKNPVALWSHDSFTPPIGKASNVVVQNGKRDPLTSPHGESLKVRIGDSRQAQLIQNGSSQFEDPRGQIEHAPVCAYVLQVHKGE